MTRTRVRRLDEAGTAWRFSGMKMPMELAGKRVLVVGACLILLLVVVRWLLTSGVLALP